MQIIKLNNVLKSVQIFQMIPLLKIIQEYAWMFVHWVHMAARKYCIVLHLVGGLIMQILLLICVFKYVL